MMIKKILLATTVMVFGISAFAGPTSAATQMGGLNASAPVAVDEDGDEEGGEEGGEEDYNFEVVNDTGHEISELYIDAADETEWGEDLTGDEGIEDGGTLKLTYDPEGNDAEAEMFDMKLVWEEAYEDGTTEDVWTDLDLKDAHKITLHYDAETTTPTATVE